ncbi:hypothetical protein [Streptosporangium roseum]|uniref:Uncharacterized protein n=1 Tax=Streptosporangium roseum (strain ATCC 12428 / DSM 43021 / JCM 3005 / KCTC 9067 / NCIMB 10171 / NRRL 2505 / NI 9100) TaxID=479432 RepID=D2B709_STRRD|nr:hypothetical protein [Streptosporangium roseum]ACZ87747.1 hypothetical protein Sros_4940 [Streptosporangium roseum DSM 43021]
MPDLHDRRSALALSDAGGHGRIARVGLASAIVGRLIIAAAEVIWPSNRDLGDVLFSVSPILTGAGLVTAGVAIIRAGVWARPSRTPYARSGTTPTPRPAGPARRSRVEGHVVGRFLGRQALVVEGGQDLLVGDAADLALLVLFERHCQSNPVEPESEGRRRPKEKECRNLATAV